MLRLFVAVDVPDRIRDRLAALKTKLEGARWVPASQIHLTMRFIGDTEEEQAPRIREALRAIKAPPFTLALNGVGRFPPKREPHVLWAGLSASEPLKALAAEIERAVVSCGVEPEKREFSPHITLARLKQAKREAVEKFLEEHRELKSEPFEIDHFTLFKSLLSSAGAVHEVVESFKS